ncbi:MAG: S41 family peptidase [Bacteroidales bacterium]|nr:S41 family peptidase [Bacteroidales bacterium]
MKRTLAALAALLLLLPVQAQDKPKEDHSFSVSKNLDIFNTLYRKLDLFYVDTLDAEKLIQTGIDAMLSSLDPYTEYYADEDLGDLKMMTTGKYGGIGSIIRMRKDSTIIIAEPYEGMPAAEVGLKVGDVLKKIDGTDLKGKAVSEVSDLLRGEPGTTFVLRVQRPGEKKTRDFRITRRNIKVEPIPYYGLDGNIGYIALTQFTENCSADVRRAVISLKERGATSLVIDLRGNGGGLLNEAVSIVNLFVPKGLTIVETKGKVQMANSAYTTTAEPLDTITPLCILVSSSTASAAEIVAGSLQDLDRAVVIGTRTYGKGLVQSPQELPYNGQLKLTSSKYYIPSGRCIQAINYRDRRELGKDGRVPDSLTNVFKTRNGREVRDGGGIKPDIEVRHDTMANVVYYLSTDDVLTDWGTLYTQKHPTIPPIGTFAITEADFEQLKKMAREADFKYDRLSEKRLEDLKKMMEFEGYYEDATDEFKALEQKLTHNMERDFDRRRDDIIELMEQEIVKRYYYQRGVVEQALQHDDDLKRAHEILSQPDEYKRILQP